MILQISRVQMRRGLQEDLPQSLASAELGWSIDERRLFIGNGSHEEGAPVLGNTEILTTHSKVLSLDNTYTFKGLLGGYEVQTGTSVSNEITRSMQDKFDDLANIRDFSDPTVGDGVINSVDSFNRAITQLFKASEVDKNPAVRRTLYVPAGVYKLSGDYIRMLPYVKLKGDGKNTTFIIQTDATQPCTVMSTDLKIAGVSVIQPGNIEIEGITLVNMTGNDVVILNSSVDVLLRRVRMRGDDDITIAPPTTLSTPATACLRIVNQTGMHSSANIEIDGCDFSDKSYGIYAKDKTSNVNITGSTFIDLYQGVVLGKDNVGNTMPSGIKVSHSFFDRIAAEGILAASGYSDSEKIVSAFNVFGNVGNVQRIPTIAIPVVAPFSSIIFFGGKNCYSFGDTFSRDSNSSIQPVNLNGKSSYAMLNDGQIMFGKQRLAGGIDITLLNAVDTSIVAGVVGFEDYPTIVEYTILRNTNQRVGTLHITPIAGSVMFSDDYVETDDLGISLIPTLNNNLVELNYTSTPTQYNSILKIASRTLTGNKAPAILPASVPGAPTNVVATLPASVPGAPTDVVASLVLAVPGAPTNVVATLPASVPGAPTDVVASLVLAVPDAPTDVVATLLNTIPDAPTDVVATLLNTIPDAPTDVVATSV